jgi:hypothetical protein
LVQPDGVLDDEHGETVAVGLGVGHSGSAYPNPIKATQPFDELGEEVGKHASHTKLGHELLKFASDLKHAPGEKADRALHQLNVGQVN